jgi:hypothetical protein
MACGLGKPDHQLAPHERIAMRIGRGQKSERHRQQGVSRKYGGCFVEGLVNRWFSASEIVVVHRGKIVVNERIGMHTFDGGRHPAERAPIDTEQPAALLNQKTAQAFSASQRGVAHGFEKSALGAACSRQKRIERTFRKRGRFRERGPEHRLKIAGIGHRRFEVLRVPVLTIESQKTVMAPLVPRLILLRHKFACALFLRIGAAQQGQRGRAATRATINRRRIVAIEFGTWRSVRSGGGLELMTSG